ncbi:hypothetical protein EV700_0910 [Fluviicoccus keumensis]|uniref:DUF1415 domain-containing protein n=1 Tax=Fluviicoccus keumensis TaxID=1435465 RepID=A0A4Q7ZCR8_9GAMM|nr:DUF1415 domain-containing protein [Fluviicoccus keumensis]RZU47941.1 hypothetical protein EV700_0910 [Fluviicoccus keumensis]
MTPACPDTVIAETRAWVRRAVIGLNLCPFARAVDVKDRMRYIVSDSTDPALILEQMLAEFALLAETPADEIETTLLILTGTFTDFLDFNDFLEQAERRLRRAGLEGEFQIASFHPAYQFAGTEPDDIGNATNRSPWPTLHLLRESSIDRAVASMENPDSIYEENIGTMQRLGAEGWAALRAQCRKDAEDGA